MVIGGIVEIVLGVAAERRSLEEVASPIGMVPRIPEFGSGGYGPGGYGPGRGGRRGPRPAGLRTA
jgi:hypothetical protein